MDHVDVFIEGGSSKMDELGQRGGGGQKFQILCGRLLWMAPNVSPPGAEPLFAYNLQLTTCIN